MAVITDTISLNTQGRGDVININPEIENFLATQGKMEGLLTVFVPGSTAAITTIEYEPGLKQDIPENLERLFPYKSRYHHHETWHDDNGSSHLQAAFIGPGLSVPVKDGKCLLGTWQQIVLIDCDTRPRNRKIIIQLIS